MSNNSGLHSCANCNELRVHLSDHDPEKDIYSRVCSTCKRRVETKGGVTTVVFEGHQPSPPETHA